MSGLTDAEYERHKARVQALVCKWHRPLGLTEWRLTYEYDRTGEQMPTDGIQEGYGALASCDTNWPYRRARITFNVAAVADIKDDDGSELEEQVVHEMVHLLVDELAEGDGRKEAENHLERVVVSLARAFVRVGATTGTEAPGGEDAATAGTGGGGAESGGREDRAGASPAAVPGWPTGAGGTPTAPAPGSGPAADGTTPAGHAASDTGSGAAG